jgi:hypothetical protein
VAELLERISSAELTEWMAKAWIDEQDRAEAERKGGAGDNSKSFV